MHTHSKKAFLSDLSLFCYIDYQKNKKYEEAQYAKNWKEFFMILCGKQKQVKG